MKRKVICTCHKFIKDLKGLKVTTKQTAFLR